ncbi:hypothetical protein KJ855_02520, partial [Patescibacteria group bacterium]|nr:hypothetical protein [Patescibacteria group bacterium]
MHQSISNPPESLDNTYLEKTGVDKYANLASAQEIKELVKKENPDFKKYYHDALYTLTGQKINEKLEKQYIRDFELISRAYIESNHDKKRIIDYFSSGDNQRKLSIFETILSNTKITIEHDERPRLLSYPKFIDRTFHQINALPQKQPQNIKKIIDQNSIIFFNNVSHILDKVGLENNEETKFFITKNFVKDVLSGGFFDYLKDIYHQDMFEINYQNYIPGYDRNEHIERITYLQKQMKRLDKLFIANYQKTKKFQDQRSSLLKEIKNIEKTLAETPEKKQKDSEQELETKKTRLEKIQSDINRRKVKIQHVPVLKEAINLILEHTQYIYLLDHLKGADAFRRQLRTIIETKIGDIDIFNNNPEEPDFETLDSLITSKSHLKQNNAQHLPTILLIYSSGLDNYMESN